MYKSFTLLVYIILSSLALKSQQNTQNWNLIENGDFEDHSFIPGTTPDNTLINSAPPWVFRQHPNNLNLMSGGAMLFAPNSYYDHSFDCSNESEKIYSFGLEDWVSTGFFNVVDPFTGAITSVEKYITRFYPSANEWGIQAPKSGNSYAGLFYANRGLFFTDVFFTNCGTDFFYYGGQNGGTAEEERRGRIAIPLTESLDPSREYRWSAWISKMDAVVEAEDDPKITVYAAHNINSLDLSPQGGDQVFFTWEVDDASNWKPISHVFTPDSDYDWLIIEMANDAFSLNSKSAGLFIDDVRLVDLCRQQFFCDDKTIGDLNNVSVSNQTVSGSAVPGGLDEYFTISNLEYATTLTVDIKNANGQNISIYNGTYNNPSFEWKWDGSNNLGTYVGSNAAQVVDVDITLSNSCFFKQFTVPCFVSNIAPTPLGNIVDQENWARAPLPCCRPFIVLNNTTLGGTQTFQAIDGVIVQDNVQVDGDAEIHLIGGDYVEIKPGAAGVILTAQNVTIIENQPCVKSLDLEPTPVKPVSSIQPIPSIIPLLPDITTEINPNLVTLGDAVSIRVKATDVDQQYSTAYSIEVYSVSGQRVFKSNEQGYIDGSPMIITTGNWTTGVYVVHIVGEDGSVLDQEKILVRN